MALDETTRRWQRLSPEEIGDDLPRALRACLAAIRTSPNDPAARRTLHAVAARHGAWEQLVLFLEDEVGAAAHPDVKAAFLEELADAHETFLDQPLEALNALERLAEVVPDEVMVHDRLARLYDREGAGAKAAEAFERVARLATDDLGRAALRAAARLYRASGQPERAVAMYCAIVERRPDDDEAWRPLAELLEELGWWRDLARVRGALAERADNRGQRAALLRGQARALERAGDVEEAARLMAEAAAAAPADLGSLLEHVDVLTRGGRGREAADLLEQEIAQAVGAGAPGGDVAALQLLLADVLEGPCGDPAGAAAALDALLTSSPGHPAAAARKTAVLRDSARHLREQGDFEGAAAALERACALSPGDDEARTELEEARAALLVDRARAEAAAGSPDSAERRLRALLDKRPLDVDANLMLAQVFADQGRHEAAADHLREVLGTTPDDFPPERIARLVHRCAVAVAAAGDADEGHQLLHEAHRLDRRNLAITLALGESCFARRLWREAALHLGSLASHPDASRHAAAVAAGLVRAAQAEVRSLRPALAVRRYEEAVRIDPACAPAWHALAEQATENGDLKRAADCLEREAAATADAPARLRLWDALGDLALDVLAQPERAERCWATAAAIEPVGPGHVPVLEKLIARQRRGGDPAARADSCLRLAAVHPDPEVRKASLQEAVEAFLAAGQGERAREAAGQLSADHPDDEDTVWVTSEAALASGDHEAAAALLGRTLSAWDAAGSRGDGDPRRAELWRRLGDARRGRGDGRGAAAAYQRAVATAPESDGALAARRTLAELQASLGLSAVDHLRALVEADPRADDVLALARALAAAAAEGAGPTEDARALFQLAGALGAPLAAADEEFLERHPARRMASDEAYAATLSEAEQRALIAGDDDGPLADELEALWEAAALLCPAAPMALAAAGLETAERASPVGSMAAAALYPQIARMLGGPVTLLYTTAARAAPDVTLLLASPPVVVLGPRLASPRAQSRGDVDAESDAELRFRLGRVVELARPRRVFAASAGFPRFLAALGHAFGRGGSGPEDPALAAEAERLRTTLPVRLRSRLAERLPALSAGDADPARYLAACRQAADRAGLIACGDAAVAIEAAGGPAVAPHLVRLAASRAYLDLRRRLRR